MVKKFKKHKFIPMEKLAKSFLDSKKINIGLKNDAVDAYQIERTGFAQYVITGVENKEIIIKCIAQDGKASFHDFFIRFNELYKIKGFEYLEGYTKVKPIFTIYDYKKERMDIEGYCFPSGRFTVELIGLLVK